MKCLECIHDVETGEPLLRQHAGDERATGAAGRCETDELVPVAPLCAKRDEEIPTPDPARVDGEAGHGNFGSSVPASAAIGRKHPGIKNGHDQVVDLMSLIAISSRAT
jgi:hypothetical protein